MLSNAPRMVKPRAISSGLARRATRPPVGSRCISIRAVENFRTLHSKRQALGLASHVQNGYTRHWFRESQKWGRRSISGMHEEKSAKKRNVFIALGSNMGDRTAMIEQACKEMESTGKIRIVRTSSLWESKAMYVLDQDNFVNGACEVCSDFVLLWHRINPCR